MPGQAQQETNIDLGKFTNRPGDDWLFHDSVLYLARQKAIELLQNGISAADNEESHVIPDNVLHQAIEVVFHAIESRLAILSQDKDKTISAAALNMHRPFHALLTNFFHHTCRNDYPSIISGCAHLLATFESNSDFIDELLAQPKLMESLSAVLTSYANKNNLAEELEQQKAEWNRRIHIDDLISGLNPANNGIALSQKNHKDLELVKDALRRIRNEKPGNHHLEFMEKAAAALKSLTSGDKPVVIMPEIAEQVMLLLTNKIANLTTAAALSEALQAEVAQVA